MKKILVTGSSGYIGSHLIQILCSKNIIVHGLDKDLPKASVDNFILQNITDNNSWDTQEEYDCVIHLAAEVSVGNSVKDPTLYFLTNTLGTLNVLNQIRTKNFIFASTGAAANLESPYGISKRMAEDIVHQHCIANSINFTIFRFYNVVGSDGFSPTNPDGLMWNLINAKTIGEFNLFGNDYNTPDGTAIRDYVHVNEICNAIIKAINTPSHSIENLGHGYGTSVKEMIDIFKLVNDCNFNVNICPRRNGDIERSVLDNPSPFMQKLYNLEDLLKV